MIRETKYNEVFDAQRHFRLILDSMSRPGKINQLADISIESPENLNQASALAGFAFLNADAGFYVLQNQEIIHQFLITNTSSVPLSPGMADFIFVNDKDASGIWDQLKTGTLEYPEDSATLIIDTQIISNAPLDQSLEITLKGPGIPATQTIFIKGITKDILNAFMYLNSEYPLGIDAILTDSKGQVICLPRTTHCTF